MRNPLRRYYGQGHFHFVTVSCYRRLPLLGTQYSRDLFVKTLGDIRSQYEFQLVGYVVMPEHVHLLIGEPKKGNPSKVLQVLKQKTSRALGTKKRTSIDRAANERPSFLATALLRFQRLEREENHTEARIHARKSRCSRISGTPQRLALEQLVILRKGRGRNDPNRWPRVKKHPRDEKAESRTAPLKITRVRHPQTKSLAPFPASASSAAR